MRCGSFVYPGSVWWRCFAPSTKMIDNKSQHRLWRNKSLSTIQETIKMWWSTFFEGQVVVDNVAMPTTRERVLSKYSTVSKQWTSRYSWSESPSVLLRPQRQEVTYMMTIRFLHRSTVIGTGQTGSPLAEIEEETDLFLKTVAKSLWGLLCVLDKVVI